MLDALLLTLGNISLACEKARINRSTHYQWLKDDPKYAEELSWIHERKIDFYEQALSKLVHKGNVTAIIFGLKTLAKDRGYVERQEIDANLTHNDITFKIIRNNDDKKKPTD